MVWVVAGAVLAWAVIGHCLIWITHLSTEGSQLDRIINEVSSVLCSCTDCWDHIIMFSLRRLGVFVREVGGAGLVV